MDVEALADELAEQLQAMSRGQYLALWAALEQLEGELRISPEWLAEKALEKPIGIEVDGADGAIVLRLKPRGL